MEIEKIIEDRREPRDALGGAMKITLLVYRV